MSKPRNLSKSILTLTILVGVTPLSALLSAKIYAMIWRLLLSPQFGDGPSYESWYGITILLSVLTHHLLPKPPAEPTAEAKPLLRAALDSTVAFYVHAGLGLLFAAFVRLALGWP